MQGSFLLGEWLVQPSAGQISRNGHTIHVRAKVMDLLVFLAQRPGEVIAKDLLLDGVWGTDALSESALTRSMTELRQALDDDAEHPRVIETIPKRGYRVIVPVSPAPSPAPANGSGSPTTQITGKGEAAPEEPPAMRARPGRPLLRVHAVWGMTGLMLGLATAGLTSAIAFTNLARSPDRPLVRFLLLPPAGNTFAAVASEPQPAVSPDGRRIATVAMARDATVRIWVYTLDSLGPRALAGTEGASAPFWSPDSEWIGFFAQGKLKKMRAEGGPIETLCDAPAGWGATWNAQGTVLFAPTRFSGLYSVPASGGTPVPVTTLDAAREETSHWFPQFLSDGVHYIYLARGNRPEHRAIYLGSLGSTERKHLVDVDSNAAFVEPGYLLFVRNGVLMAQAFDSEQMALTGNAVPVAEHVLPAPTVRRAPFSAGGMTLTYRSGGMQKARLVWLDRKGRSVGTIGDPERYLTPALSPDGTQIAIDIFDVPSGRIDTWTIDLARDVSSRFTFGPSPSSYPIWPSDGGRIIYASNRTGTWDLYVKSTRDEALQSTPGDHALLESRQDKYPQDWSSAGVVYAERSDKTGFDLWLLPSAAPRKPIPLLQTPFNETHAQVSPDGRWLAYSSDESGKLEVYVRSIGAIQGKWRVSKEGGCQPRWRADGKELYFVHGQGLYAVSIDGTSTLNPGIPVALFETQAGRTSELTWEYVPSRHGERFLFKELLFEENASPMAVVLNWQSMVER